MPPSPSGTIGAMSEKLLDVRQGPETEGGIWPSAAEREVPLWREGQNIFFHEGGAKKFPGWTGLVTQAPNDHVRGAEAMVNSSGAALLFFADTDEIYLYDGSSVTSEKSGLTGIDDATSSQDATVMSFARFGNWMLASNGVDAGQVWKGSSFANLSGTTWSTAEIILVRGPHVLAFNTDNGGNIFEWCDEDDVETWTAAANNAAGNLYIRELFGDIKAAVNFGDQIAVLGRDQLFLVRYIGTPFYFGYKPGPRGIGAVSKRAVIAAEDLLYGWGPAGIWRSDGVQHNYIDTPQVRKYIEDNLSTAQQSKVHAQFFDRDDTIVWWFPDSTGEIAEGISLNIKTGAFGHASGIVTASVPHRNSWDHDLAIDADGVVRCYGAEVDADGSAVESFVRTKKFDFGEPNFWKTLDFIHVSIARLAGTVQVRAGWAENIDDTPSWSEYQTLDDGLEAVYFGIAGRFLQLEFYSNAVGGNFIITGFTMYGMIDGEDT